MKLIKPSEFKNDCYTEKSIVEKFKIVSSVFKLENAKKYKEIYSQIAKKSNDLLYNSKSNENNEFALLIEKYAHIVYEAHDLHRSIEHSMWLIEFILTSTMYTN